MKAAWLLKPERLTWVNPILVSLFPVLFLYSRNMDEVPFSNAGSALLIVIAAAVVGLAIVWLVLRDGVKAGFLVSTLVLLFFIYGHVYDLIEGKAIGGVVVGRYSILLVVTVILGLILLGIVLKLRRFVYSITPYITGVLGILVAVNAITIVVYHASPPGDNPVRAGVLRGTDSGASDGLLPDIYYVILDSYAREDVLKDLYRFDNAEFLDYLRGNDFYVASESRPNYIFTFLSLSSALNMMYLDDVVEAVGRDSRDHSVPHDLIRNNEVMRFLKSKGYRIVLLPSPWTVTQSNPQADITARVSSEWSVGQAVLEPIIGNDFGSSLLMTTGLAPFARQFGWIATHEAELFTNNMGELTKIPEMEGPTFTFAHFFPPHAPYIFDRDGNVLAGGAKLTDATDRPKYVEQLIWVNKSIQSAVGQILAKAKDRSVIIVQGDHGPASLELVEVDGLFSGDPDEIKEKASVLNAYHLPEACESPPFYQSITPVNSLRLVFDSCLGTELGLLEDRTYWSRPERPFTLTLIEELLAETQN